MSLSKPIVMGGKLKLKGTGSSTKKRKLGEAVERAEPAAAINAIEDKKIRGAATITSTAPISGGNSAKEANNVSKADSFLTEAQRRHKQKQLEQEAKAGKHLMQSTYRDRIEEFNLRLATTTEHNDIPRISAAGNG